jgi:hypothetical protein
MPRAREGLFERDSNVVDYWLAHCEGFKLGKATSGRRVTGVVCDQRTGRARTLFVESGLRRSHAVPAQAIAAVDPFNKVLYLEKRAPALPALPALPPLPALPVRSSAEGVLRASSTAARRVGVWAAAAFRAGGRHGRDGVVWLRPRLRAAAWTTAWFVRTRYAEAALWLMPRVAAGLRAIVAYAYTVVEAVHRRRSVDR